MRRGRVTANTMTSAMSSGRMARFLTNCRVACLVVGELGCHRAGLDDDHADVGRQLLAERL
jgi:hypothetical protein